CHALHLHRAGVRPGGRTSRGARPDAKSDLTQARFHQQAMKVRAVDAGSSRCAGYVVAVLFEDLLQVAPLEVVHPLTARHAKWALDGDGGEQIFVGLPERKRPLEGEAALDIVAQLANVARPLVAGELVEEGAAAQSFDQLAATFRLHALDQVA